VAVVNEEMRGYYERRAPEYDEWWLAPGRWKGRERPGWTDEVAELLAAIEGLAPARTLDVACGTAFLTRHLPGEITALDQSAAMLEVARPRLPHARLVQGDAVPLPFPDGEFDRLFTGHFYGHLLADERSVFLAEARRVAGELVVVDSALREGIEAEVWQERTTSDGARHRVYKRYFDPDELADELGGGEVLHGGRWFVAVASRSLHSPTDR
jgi:demethylmenaquinone methyltransferase/2-methoxy-6-polyprenyl-1,4-benzoquinol methylase